MFTSEFKIRVRYGETDQMNVVYHANYITYFEVGRTEAIRELGFTYREMEDMGVEMPVTEIMIRYLRSAQYDDILTIKTQLRTLPDNHHIDFYQEIFNEKGKLITSGKVTLFFLDKSTKKRSKMPEVLREKMSAFFVSE
ncbi:MAG: acyl-CoA thioesterase [Chitinophagaceae bacterium]